LYKKTESKSRKTDSFRTKEHKKFKKNSRALAYVIFL